jgi:hypothetical protein
MELKMFCMLPVLLKPLFFSSHATSFVESDSIFQWTGRGKKQDATITKAFLITKPLSRLGP